jgi:thiol-disulfide isomerase/thioredoxin
LVAFCFAGFMTSASAAGPDSTWWPRLNVHDLQGEPLQPAGRWVVLVFLSPECPVANADIPVLNALATEFAPQGISFIGVYADPNLKLPELRQHAADYHLTFATADDRAQQLVRATGATYTPEVFVFSRDGALLYRGRIDDRVVDLDTARPAATRQDLREVLSALAAGRSVPFARQRGFGCAIPQLVKP